MNVEQLMAEYDAYLNYMVMEAIEYEGVEYNGTDYDDFIQCYETPKEAVKIDDDVYVQDGFFRVNKATGEILGEYVASPYKGISNAQYAREYKIVPSPINARSEDDIKQYIKLSVDKRKLFTVNQLTSRVYEDAGRSEYTEHKKVFSKPQYKVLQQLIEMVQIHNVLVVKRKHLADVLGIHENHIMRKLDIAKPHIKVQTEGMQRGFIKVIINPDLVFKAESKTIPALREQAYKAFYNDKLFPWNTYSEQIEFLCSPSNRVDYDVEKFSFEGKKFSAEFIAWLDSFKPTKDNR